MGVGKISIDDVRQTATLARLELSDAEVQRLTRELDAILGYMDLLSTLDVSNVEPTTHAVPVELTLRDDKLEELEPHLSLDLALRDAPRRHDGLFEVPKIIEVAE
jgi:aspartyl-tRNA(Asn)/glutamyl-tRNA(Gln) amidotransferase subunit C